MTITTTDRRTAWRLRALQATGRIPDGDILAWHLSTGSYPSTERACIWCGRNHNRRAPACRNCEE